MSILRPCPFCGCKEMSFIETTTATKTYLAVVFCTSCYCKSAEGSSGLNIKDARIEASMSWNNRVDNT